MHFGDLRAGGGRDVMALMPKLSSEREREKREKTNQVVTSDANLN